MKKQNKFKFLWSLSVTCLLLFNNVITAQAKEVTKTISVNLTEDYLQCGFYISFENPGESLPEAIVTTPQGKKYSASIDPATGEYKATLRDVKAGEYTVTIIKQTEEGSDAEIGKVTVSVKAEKETIDTVTNNLQLTKEISGLQVYWKDDSIVVCWDDETVGNVNISVVDSKTLQILDSKTIAEKYYEFPISAVVEEILLTIVPSVSQNVFGAGDEYVLKVDNHPSGEVVFEAIEYTNKDTIKATVTLQEEYSLLYENNGVEIGSTEILSAGTHEIEIPTQIGENNVKVYIVDKNHNMRSTAIQFIKDIEPPVIKIEEDINGISTKEDSITFKGIVEDFDTLIFRNKNIPVEWDGSFEITASLKDGQNELLLTAADKAGNETVYKAIVEKPIPQSIAISWDIIIAITGILFIIIFFFLKKRMNINLKFSLSKKEKKEIAPKKNEKKSDYLYFGITIMAYIFLIYGVFQFAVVQSGSMEPTIKKKEFVITNRLAYKIKTPKRGDIITFKSPDSNIILLKRIVGLPGDEISFTNGYLFINGYMCDESAYLDKNIETNSNETFLVPENCYFVLGDNRSGSYDSRYWDNPYISIEDIQGKMLMHLNFSEMLNLH